MTKMQARLVIMADEWLGVAFLAWLHHQRDEWFVPVLVFWVVAVYLISYPLYWLEYSKRERSSKPGFGEDASGHVGNTYWGDSVRRSTPHGSKGNLRKLVIIKRDDTRKGETSGEAIEVRSGDTLHRPDDPKAG